MDKIKEYIEKDVSKTHIILDPRKKLIAFQKIINPNKFFSPMNSFIAYIIYKNKIWIRDYGFVMKTSKKFGTTEFHVMNVIKVIVSESLKRNLILANEDEKHFIRSEWGMYL